MISFSDQAVAAYDLLVNKRHEHESETLWKVSSSVTGIGDKLNCSAEETYSNFRNYAPPLDVKGGIIAEKVVPVFSESSFLACFGLVM